MPFKPIKELAREAKSRMNSARARSGSYCRSYLLNDRFLSEEEVGEIYRRMLRWMHASPCDILSRLRDSAERDALEGAQREKYVLQLSDIYRSLRQEYEQSL